MEHRTSVYSVALCAILSAQLVLSPIFAASAYAAGVTPDPNAPGNKRPSMDVSANGVPLVNITAPNSSGLSHNQYSDFNVRQQGLILNNSSQAVNTQIGGVIAGNPNFYGDPAHEARTILNEVTSANRSRIEGYIEVGGRAADVILANPNGITVNGGGFINVPRATLSTGVPQVNSAGALTGHEVKRGDISIEGAGINADNTDAFSLLARTAYVEAQVRGKNVTVVAGRNNVATDGTVTPLADDPANPKPQIAIDSSALGGMYANRITLIATEKGVGVNLEGTVQSADQMVITADGKLRLREASSGGNAVLASNGDVEVVGGSVTAANNLTVAADNLRVKKGSLEPQYETRKAARQGVTPPPPAPAATPASSLLYAGNDMALATANELLNEQSEIRAARKLTISSADGRGTNRVRNSSGTIAAGTDLSITAKSLENFRTILNIQRDTGYYQYNRWVHEVTGDGDEVWKDTNTIDKSIDILAPSTEAGIISADNDIMLVLEAFSNYTGHIAAGRNLSLLATTSAVNASAALYRNTYTKIEYEHWDEDDDYVGRDHRFVYYTDREVVRPFSASITAADTLTITGATLQNTTDRSNTSPLTTRDTAEVAGAVAALNESAMFHTVTTPGHRYRIETNPALTKLGDFYGSDYFLSRIGLDQKKQQVVLLGDAYYETRLVQQQVLQSTGHRFLNGYSSDADQMRGLMDAAVAQGKALNLAAGVELTSAQVAALTQDIVWLVEQEVDGQKVYVPRVYLAANSPNSILTGGSLVAANTVNITADSVTNSGSTIRGANSLTMLAGNITNEEGGTLSGKNVQLAAVQDIRNQGAYIAGETLSLTAGRDIISAAKVELAEGSSAKASQSRVARASGISATSTLQATAGRDVTLTGSGLLTGGDASITAGHDITVGSAVTFMERHAKRLDESSTTNHGSAVAVGGNLTMTAGNDLTVAGSTVVAQNNAVLAAARNLSVTATQDTYSFHMRSSKSGGLGKSSSISIDKQTTTANAANVGAGGNLTLAAGNKADISSRADVLVKGSQLQAGKTADISATGNVVFQAAQNSVFTSISKSSSSLFSASAKKQASGSVTQVASSLLADNISVQAGDNIRLTASNFIAGKDIALSTTRGDVSLDAAQNSSFSKSQSKSSSVGLFGTTDGFNFFEAKTKMAESGTHTNVGSALVAGKDIAVTSGQDVNARGSLVSAGNNVSINAARDVNMLPGSSSSYAKESSSKSSAGISYSFTSEGYSERVGFNNVTTGSRQAATTNMGNLVTAGNDVSIVSTRDVNQVASHVEAKRDVTIAAGRDWNMLAATDTQEFSAWRKEWQAGATLALKQNISQAVNAVSNIPAAAGNAQGGGMFTGISAASAGLQAVSSVYNAIFQVVSASVTLGASASEQKASSSSSTAAPSTALAGHDLTAFAGQDITIQGGRVQAGNNLTLNAKRDLNVVAATNSYNFSQTASSISGGITGSIGFGASGLAASGSVSASASGSNNRGDGVSYTNALVTAGNNLNTTSGRDTNVKGVHAQGNTVDMNVGRDLNVQSLQDRAQNSGSSWALGGSIGFDITGMLPGKIAGVDVTKSNGSGLSIGGSTSSGSMAWVNGQTSVTGKEKVSIYTEKNTDLKGAVLAADNGNLLLNTGTLTHANIQDTNKQQNISAYISSGGQLGNSSLSGNYSKTDQEQINRATVGQGTIIIRSDPNKGAEGLNRDLAKAQEITKNDKVNVTVYLDSQAIKEVASGFSGTLEGIKELGENLQQIVREWKAITAVLPDSAKSLGQAGLDAMQSMIRGGASSDQVAQLMSDEKFQSLITQLGSTSAEGDTIGQIYMGSNRKSVIINKRNNASYVLDQAIEVYEFLDNIPNKELLSAALMGFQAVSAGPMSVLTNILGGELLGAATQELAAFLIIEKLHGGSEMAQAATTPESLNTEIKATQLFLDLGIGVGVATIAGGINTVGKDVKTNIWSETKTLSSIENADVHWNKHSTEFPEYKNVSDYIQGAIRFINEPPISTLTKVRTNGDILLYDPITNIFAVKNQSGSPKTMFKPLDGINYWNNQ